MDRLVFGMHHLNISQSGTLIDGKPNLSHPNYALDLCGSDTGIDYFWNKESDTCFYCSGSFGTRNTGNTRFFVTCDYEGKAKKVMCADGKERVITLAMTHSNKDYQLYKIYKPNEILYQEGDAGKATGMHIHLEVAEGSVKTKYYDNNLKCYRMKGEMNPVNAFFILDGFTTVVSTHGLTFKHCAKTEVEKATDTGDKGDGMDISKYNDVQLARMCYDGTFGNGEDRKKALGSRYKIVQELVEIGKNKLDDILDEPTDALKLVKLAQYQIGNKGRRYWDFMGEENEWCSEFVAYTGYCLGYIKDGKMPKANECWKAHDFYRSKGELHQKSGYYPKAGDIAYFGDKGLLHTSIVKSYDGKTLHTIDGNQYIDSQTWRTSIVKECSFNINDGYVWGFANPLTQGKTGWEYKDKKWYFYDNGVLVKGWKKIQWKQGNDWFWFDSNGVMVTGWRKINWSGKDRWFYFTQDGAMVTGLQYLEWQGKKDWYLFDQNGAMVTGKQKAEIVLNGSGQLTGGKKI